MGHPTTSALPGEFPTFYAFLSHVPARMSHGGGVLEASGTIVDHKLTRHYLSLLYLPSATTVGHGIGSLLQVGTLGGGVERAAQNGHN